MLRQITTSLEQKIASSKLAEHLERIWIYRGICAVADFRFRGVRFGFNVTPVQGGKVNLDIVERSHNGIATLIAGANKKINLATNVDVEKALGQMIDKLQSVLEILGSTSVGGVGLLEKNAPPSNLIAKRTKEPKRVGVMTLPLNSNYGGNLQVFALVRAIANLGHTPVFINRRHPRMDADQRPIDDGVSTSNTVMGTSVGLGKSVPNTSFTDKWLAPMTRRFTSSADLRANVTRLGLDAVVVGSDQIWRPRYAKSTLFDLFCDFIPDGSGIRKLSYAASFGTAGWEFSDEEVEKAKKLLNHFDAVSVREDSAVMLAKRHFQVTAEHVLDPTLLLMPEEYTEVIAEAKPSDAKGQLITYILDVNEDKINFVNYIAEVTGTRPVRTDGTPFPSGDRLEKGEEDKSVQGWVAAFRDAGFIATDSFHGVAFSILFNKPFIAYGNPGRGLARFRSILKMFDLEDRLVVKSEDFDSEQALQPINWANVNAKLDELRRKSYAFLEAGITGGHRAGGGNKKSHSSRSKTPTPMQFPIQISRKDVRANGANPLGVLCTGCGVCVSEADNTLEMGWDSDGFLVPQSIGTKPVPSRAIKVCPFNTAPDAQVQDEDALANIFLRNAPKRDARAGSYINSYIGYSKRYRETSSSGGIATYALNYLLSNNEVDAIFVVEGDGATGYRYNLFTSIDEISSISKTRYFPVTLESLFRVIDDFDGRIAITGVACFIKAMRLKQYYRPALRQKVPFMIGIMCGGLKSRYYTDYLAQSAGIFGNYSGPQYRVKNAKSVANDYSFSALAEDGTSHSVRMLKLGDMWGTGLFKARACDFCTDVLTELSDISLGDAWLPDYKKDGMGNSVVITRTPLAEKIINYGIQSEELHIAEVPISQISQSQSAGFNHKQNSVRFRELMARAEGDVPVPHIRKRLQPKVTVAEAMVQIVRERTRRASIVAWNDNKSNKGFTKRMKEKLLTLRKVTSDRNNGKIPGLVVRDIINGPSKDLPRRAIPGSMVGRLLRRKLRYRSSFYRELINDQKIFKD